eukprot:1143517-Pelagomonas_calceolata.AAC.18
MNDCCGSSETYPVAFFQHMLFWGLLHLQLKRMLVKNRCDHDRRCTQSKMKRSSLELHTSSLKNNLMAHGLLHSVMLACTPQLQAGMHFMLAYS